MEYSPQQNVPDQCKMRGSSRDIYSIEFDRIIHEKSAITSDAISTFFVIPTLEELRTSLGGKLSFVCWWAQRENSLYVGDRVQFFFTQRWCEIFQGQFAFEKEGDLQDLYVILRHSFKCSKIRGSSGITLGFRLLS